MLDQKLESHNLNPPPLPPYPLTPYPPPPPPRLHEKYMPALHYVSTFEKERL